MAIPTIFKLFSWQSSAFVAINFPSFIDGLAFVSGSKIDGLEFVAGSSVAGFSIVSDSEIDDIEYEIGRR